MWLSFTPLSSTEQEDLTVNHWWLKLCFKIKIEIEINLVNHDML